MRILRKGQKGFTLIELLIVVAILGVLAAVVIPNVQRFIGAGTEEAKETELANIQAAVSSMMVDNELATLPVPVTTATNDMSAFPDATTTLETRGADPTFVSAAVANGDITAGQALPGYLLYGHPLIIDVDGDGIYDEPDGDEIRIAHYVVRQTTSNLYTVDQYGTVTQS